MKKHNGIWEDLHHGHWRKVVFWNLSNALSEEIDTR